MSWFSSLVVKVMQLVVEAHTGYAALDADSDPSPQLLSSPLMRQAETDGQLGFTGDCIGHYSAAATASFMLDLSC
jgi:hypothetical protein